MATRPGGRNILNYSSSKYYFKPLLYHYYLIKELIFIHNGDQYHQLERYISVVLRCPRLPVGWHHIRYFLQDLQLDDFCAIVWYFRTNNS